MRADIGGGVAERNQVVLHHRAGALLQRVQVAEGFVFRDSPAPRPPRSLALIGHITSVRLPLSAHSSRRIVRLEANSCVHFFVLLFSFSSRSLSTSIALGRELAAFSLADAMLQLLLTREHQIVRGLALWHALPLDRHNLGHLGLAFARKICFRELRCHVFTLVRLLGSG